MTHGVPVIDTKVDDLTLILRTSLVEGGDQLPHVVL